MEAGEYEHLIFPVFHLATFVIVIFFMVHLDMQVTLDQLQQGIGLQDILPEIGGLMSIGIDRILGIQVEGKKPGAVALQASGHVDLFVTHGKVDQAPLELEQGFIVRFAIVLVLLDCVFNELTGQGIFQFRRNDRNPVQEDTDVQRIFISPTVFQLADKAKAILFV